MDPDALKAYGSTIEEARADLFGLYYVADPKLVELKLLSSPDAYKAQYYTYLMNGLMTQLVRIEPGNTVEEAHMRNRQLIARWVFEKGAADKVTGRLDTLDFSQQFAEKFTHFLVVIDYDIRLSVFLLPMLIRLNIILI